MHELWLQAYSYFCGVWRYRWYAILVAWVVVIAGWAYVAQMPDRYESSARVYVDTDSLLRPLLKGLAIQPNVEQRLRIMTQTLLSRPNLEEVMRQTDMDLSVATAEKKENLLNRLEEHISIKGGRRDNLYTIAYEGSDPRLAQRVVRSLLNIFVESTMGASRRDTNTAQQFIDQQIKEYEKLLRSAEKELMDFKRKHVGLMPNEQGDYYQRLQTALDSLQGARTELSIAIDRRDALKRQLKGEEPVFGFGTGTLQTYDGESSGPVAARIQSLQEKLDEVLLKYTDKHPEVAALKETIAMLREQKTHQSPLPSNPQEQAEGSDEMGGVDAGGDFYHQQMQIALAEAEADVASRKARVTALEQNVKELRELVDTIPKVEAELAQLNRDYGVYKSNYEQLLVRRESAKIGEKVEESPDNVKFRIVDPPTQPLLPSGPDRFLLITLVLLAAGGVGVAFAFLLSQLKPAFYTRRDLEDITGLPVLGSVSMVLSGRILWKRRLNLISFFLALGLLIAGYGLLVSNYLFGIKVFDTINHSLF
ncbi:polysaccharide chain length determinant protein, PEP-CTERM locus subfamily [Nitrosococcus halophilus Nc 4]|uniref:Polysaccharide chain length determinant protein, PEP-CTERM locus subfamily n=1 Tax=Nitrosococcus halophilus (strain Nc4) TaxID=472759 RepID=D5C046_NITHN|nr:XrtA system polysaccharide chain length determinant [Nitrosococcus halophilus]ADE16293.1 polysaccharide chain length determinant protein, PEP-CTERM locus subfamily [Nitrosococcus halophilus Nc 4]